MKIHPEISPDRLTVKVELPFDPIIRRPEHAEPRELILLLHGYATKGRTIYKRLESVLPEDALVVAPNALFPMPQRTESGTRISFAWYFYDFKIDEYFVDKRPAIQFLQQALKALGAWELPKRLIGFSQGGYLAPDLALALPGVRQVIGIGARPLDDELPLKLPFRLDHVHGDQDEFVSHEPALKAHARFVAAGTPGRFEVIPGLKHEIDERVRDVVRQFLLVE